MMAKKTVEYEKLTKELEEIFAQLQSSNIEIDAAVVLHARGEKIIVELEDYLTDAENKVHKITSQA